MSSSLKEKKLGQYFVNGKLITDEQLKKALFIQKASNEKIASIIIVLGYCTEKNVLQFLYRKLFVLKKKRKINPELEKEFGEILVHYKVISIQDFIAALEIQKKLNAKLGKILIDLGYITENAIVETFTAKFFSHKPIVKTQRAQEKRDISQKPPIETLPEPLLEPALELKPTISPRKKLLIASVVVVLVSSLFFVIKTITNIDNNKENELLKSATYENIAAQELIAERDEEIFEEDVIEKQAISDPVSDLGIESEIKEEEVLKQAVITKEVAPVAPQKVQTTKGKEEHKYVFSAYKDAFMFDYQLENLNTTDTITIKNIRYSSNESSATFVIDSDKALGNNISRTYLENQYVTFIIKNSQLVAQKLKNGYSDNIIQDYSVTSQGDTTLTFRMKNLGTAKYHRLNASAENPLYRLVISVKKS